MKTPLEKSITHLQSTFAENNSKEVPITKARMEEILYECLGVNIPIVRNARKRLIEEGFILYPKGERCVLYLEKIKEG